MKVKVSWILLIWMTFIPEYVRNENIDAIQHTRAPLYADILSNELKVQSWNEDEQPCLDAMLTVVDHAKNFTLWAVWVLDAIQIPTGQLYGQKYHVGSYDECLKPHYGFRVSPDTPKTHYCLADVSLVELEEKIKPIYYVAFEHNVTADVYMKKPTKHGRVLSQFGWGLCVPTVCRPSAVVKVARALLRNSHLGILADKAMIDVTHCEGVEALTDTSIGPVIFKNVVLCLAMVAIFCTYYVKSGKATPGTFVGELASSFNLSRNMETLTKVRDDEVYSMNLMRVTTSFFIVFIHYVLITYTHFIVNGLDQEISHEETGDTSSHIEVLVDTFLALSGILFVRGLFGDKSKNPLKFIWKRYIRLVAALAAVVVYMAVGHTSDGPLWNKFMSFENSVCANNWLNNLLMMGNVFHTDHLCVLATWYVPCDFQLCVFVTLLFLIYKKNETLGKYAFAVSFLGSIIIPGVLTYHYGLAPLLFDGVQSMAEVRGTAEFNYFYIKSYCRAGPFLLGAVLGYIMYNYKPKDHRKTISTSTSCVAVAVSLVLMYEILALGNYFYVQDQPFNTAVYAAINRTLWGLAICVIIGVSEYGTLPLLNKVFSWYPLVPLSRLTYGVYLTHFPLLELLFCSMRAVFEFELFTMGMGAAGATIYSLTASLIIWLLFEAPVININNMVLDKTWRNKPEEVRLDRNKHEEKKRS